ncbi:MAG: reverse transcriptase-like protein [Lachnospiraceae bacterium]|nr:reverse transcriptase-like protein [Lachnospiraceae bacterium]
MAAKKYYAVRKGKITGVFETWEECKHSVDGFSGAEYKGFSTLQEACDYAGIKMEMAGGGDTCKTDIPTEGTLLAYVDGSYDDTLKKYAFGCVFILPDGKIYTIYGNGDNPQSLQHRNVTGEMLGAMYAVKTAMQNGYSALEIRYDYEGIEKWVTGAWRSKHELTQKYALTMREWMRDISITFTKVPAHSHVKYNEVADQMAKKGLTQGEGVPKVKKLEEMDEYGIDSIE